MYSNSDETGEMMKKQGKKMSFVHHNSSEIKSHGIKWIEAPYVGMLYI